MPQPRTPTLNPNPILQFITAKEKSKKTVDYFKNNLGRNILAILKPLFKPKTRFKPV